MRTSGSPEPQKCYATLANGDPYAHPLVLPQLPHL